MNEITKLPIFEQPTTIKEAKNNINKLYTELSLLRRQSIPKKEKFLYFIQLRNKVKIGISSNPEGRLNSLATASPDELRLIAKIPNAGNLESKCHKKLSHLHICREWFRYSEDITHLIEKLQSKNQND